MEENKGLNFQETLINLSDNLMVLRNEKDEKKRVKIIERMNTLIQSMKADGVESQKRWEKWLKANSKKIDINMPSKDHNSIHAIDENKSIDENLSEISDEETTLTK